MIFYRILQWTKDWHRGNLLGGVRSNRWPRIRAEYLKEHPICEITGSTKRLSVHHKKSFHEFPELENDMNNLITLSENAFGSNIHLIFGHLGNYRKINNDISEDIKIWHNKLKGR